MNTEIKAITNEKLTKIERMRKIKNRISNEKLTKIERMRIVKQNLAFKK